MATAPQVPSVWHGKDEESAWTAGWYCGYNTSLQAWFKEKEELTKKLADAQHEVAVWKDQLIELNIRARVAISGFDMDKEIKPTESEVRVCFRLMHQIQNIVTECLKRDGKPIVQGETKP